MSERARWGRRPRDLLVPAAGGRHRSGRALAVPRPAGSLAAGVLADALVFADIALRLLLDGSSGVTASPGYRPLDGMSDGRAEVHQATGMISVQLDVSLEEAFARLRAYAFGASSALADVARAVVSRQLRFGPDPVPEN
jgi:ANTAR domain